MGINLCNNKTSPLQCCPQWRKEKRGKKVNGFYYRNRNLLRTPWRKSICNMRHSLWCLMGSLNCRGCDVCAKKVYKINWYSRKGVNGERQSSSSRCYVWQSEWYYRSQNFLFRVTSTTLYWWLQCWVWAFVLNRDSNLILIIKSSSSSSWLCEDSASAAGQESSEDTKSIFDDLEIVWICLKSQLHDDDDGKLRQRAYGTLKNVDGAVVSKQSANSNVFAKTKWQLAVLAD